MLIATAGHIDHGKTALIRAITGVETDRLPEERARGMSIDLGFAHWDVDVAKGTGGARISFIDVPGHERFIGNMLAGLSGVDGAILVVAADDGIMPQTREHLAILHLLGISRAWVALTKCDRVDAARIAEIREQISDMLVATEMAGAEIYPVSVVSGAGLDALKVALGVAGMVPEKPAMKEAFRMAIDRCFAVRGSGTVVTGTVTAGHIALGDALILSPSGQNMRVRGLQSGGKVVPHMAAGGRCAINLAGASVDDIHRGDVLITPEMHAPTSRIEVHLSCVASRDRPLRHASHVHLHIGTADIVARILLPRQTAMQAGDVGAATLVLDRAITCINGERFILRDASGAELIGGGRVVAPYIPHRQRRDTRRDAVAGALMHYDAQLTMAEMLEIGGYEIAADWFAACFNLTADMLRELCATNGAVVFGKSRKFIISNQRMMVLQGEIIALLGAHHMAPSAQSGMTAQAILRQLQPRPSVDLLAFIVRLLGHEGLVASTGSYIHLIGHSAQYNAAELALWREVLAIYEDGSPRAFSLGEVARDMRQNEAAMRAMLMRRRSNSDVWQMDERRFILSGHIAALAQIAGQLCDVNPQGFTAAQFRDDSGIGRNFTIHLLEFFDRIGVTKRCGDYRQMRDGYAMVIGE